MEPLKLNKVLAGIVTVTALLVMVGWFADIDILKRMWPGLVTMKFSTALCFALTGVTLFLIGITVESKADIAKVVAPITIGGILLLMGSLLASTFMGVRLGIGDLFVKEAQDSAVFSLAPGVPSVGTMVAFIVVAVAGIIALLNPNKSRPTLRVLGWIVVPIGVVALLGYVLDWLGLKAGQAALYYTWPGYSGAMAVHTAILFVLLG